MIYLTGDVHTNLSGHWEQKIAGKEIIAAKNYLEILKKHGVASTLFINGKCIDEDNELVKELLKYNVEIGGHTYDNFGHMGPIKSYVYRKIWGCIYGPKSYQKKDIKKTKEAFEKRDIRITSWRTHSYGSNEETYKILNEEGIKFISDIVGEVKPFSKYGIIHIPINIPTDVNTIAYGELKPESRNPFASCTKGRIKSEEWFEIIKKRITYNEKNKIDSILLIHPITMAVLDKFKLFEEIAKFLSKYKSGKISGFKIEGN
jgi:peptidoglycan/xylan/chitin deacetylase (PgdA/CDA1 family)